MNSIYDSYIELVISLKLYSNKKNLEFHLNDFFDEVTFHGKRVLEIGSGSGIRSFYAACKGAKEVYCLEPEEQGSTHGVSSDFEKLNRKLKLENVHLKRITIQDYDACLGFFDVIILYDSINHLNEFACINLKNDKEAMNIYRDIFKKINYMSNENAKIIIADCSRHNLFPLIGIKNPFMTAIEWHKHQAPSLWCTLLKEAGFEKQKLRWSTFNRLGSLGRVVFGNKVMSFITKSHFYLYAAKK